MKIEVDKKDLINALSVSSGLTKGNVSLPILSNVLILIEKECLKIKATDLNSGLICQIKTEFIDGEGKFCISCGLFLEYLQTLSSGIVTLEEKEDKLIVSQNGSRARIPLVKADEYPDFNIEAKEGILLNLNDFKDNIKRTLVSVSKDESRPILEGIYFRNNGDNLEIVGTDGYRLSISNLKYKGDWERETLIPAKSLASLLKGIEDGEIVLGVDQKNNQAFIKTESRLISFRLIAGDYPNFERIIPDGQESRVVIGKDELNTMVNQISVFARQNSNILKMEIGDKLKFSTQSGYVGSGESEGDCKFSGEELEIAFNYRYLREFLAVLPDGDVEIVFNGALAPVRLSSEKLEGFLHIIMPVKL